MFFQMLEIAHLYKSVSISQFALEKNDVTLAGFLFQKFLPTSQLTNLPSTIKRKIKTFSEIHVGVSFAFAA